MYLVTVFKDHFDVPAQCFIINLLKAASNRLFIQPRSFNKEAIKVR